MEEYKRHLVIAVVNNLRREKKTDRRTDRRTDRQNNSRQSPAYVSQSLALSLIRCETHHLYSGYRVAIEIIGADQKSEEFVCFCGSSWVSMGSGQPA